MSFKKSIRRDISIRATLLMFCIGSLIAMAQFFFFSRLSDQRFENEIVIHTQNYAEIFARNLWTFDLDSIKDIGTALWQSSQVAAISIEDQNKNIVFEMRPKDESGAICKSVPLQYQGKDIGLMRVSFSTKVLAAEKTKLINSAILILAGIFLSSLVILQIFLKRYISTPLAKLQLDIGVLAQGDYQASRITGEKEEVQGIVDSFNELSEKLQQRENSLRESEKRFRQLAENIPEVFWLGSPDWQEIYYISPAYEKIWGLHCKDINTHPMAWLEVVHEEDQAGIAASIAMEIAHDCEKIVFPEYRIVRPDGTIRWISTRAFPIKNKQGEIYRIAGICEDITVLKLAEEKKAELESQLRQSHKMEAIGTLAGGIAHDFNNILGAILGYSELALDDLPEKSPVRESIAQILNAGNRAKELVAHILSFSRKSEQQFKPVRVNAVIKEAVRLLRAIIPTTIDIRQNLAENCGVVMADPIQLNQVMMNICINAAHVMEETGGVLEVKTAAKEITLNDMAGDYSILPGRYVMITISDTGTGIDPAIIDRIFDPYFTTKKAGEGSGMGLAVVHGIIKGHDGHIRVESSLGLGTLFTIYLPETRREEIRVEESPETIAGGSEHILFVDDERMLAEVWECMLSRRGYIVTINTSSLEALRIFQDDPDGFDLVVTDQTMPGMKGSDFARELLKIRPDIPIILCTGNRRDIDLIKGQQIGIKAFSEKPLDKNNFAGLIRDVLNENQGC